MASDPSQLIANLLGAGGLNGAAVTQGTNNYNAQQLAPVQLQGAQINNQLGQQQVASNNAATAQAANYAQDEAAYAANPTADALNNMIAKYPAQFQALQAGWKLKTDDQKRADLGFLGSVHSALKSGRTDLAIQQLGDRRQAEARAGIDTTEIDQQIEALKDNDPAAIKAVQGYALAHIAAADPDAAKAMGIGGDRTHVINAGGALVGDDGNELYKAAPNETDALQVPVYDTDGTRIGTKLVPNGGKGGGGTGSSTAGAANGSGPSPQRRMGWTPRGANPDDAVDSKNAGMAQALGIGVDDQFPTGTTPAQVYRALTISEGGPGTIAYRNNNHGNLTDPKTGGYRKFDTVAQGDAAGIAQVARNLGRGQNTIRKMVEGLPIGGASVQSPSPSANVNYIGPVASSGSTAPNIVANDISTVPPAIRATVQAIADGRSAAPRPGTRNGEALLNAVTAYDPTFDAANATTRVKTRVDFTSGRAAQAVNSLSTSMGHLFHLDDQVDTLGNAGFLSGLINAPRRAVQTGIMNSTAYTTFDQTKTAAASEMRNVFSNTNGGTLPELQAWENSIDSANSPDQLHAAIKNGVMLMSSRLDALKDQYIKGMGRSDKIPQFIKPMIIDAAKHRFGIDLGSGTSSQPPSPQQGNGRTAGGFRILSVRPK